MNSPIDYILKRSRRARRVRLAVHCDGRVVVTLPYYLPARLAHQFVEQKTNWLQAKISYFQQRQGGLLFKNKPQEYWQYKKLVLKLVLSRVKHFSQIYNVSFNQVRIKNQRTIWGSCSKKKNLNFNYKIAFLPAALADYIIVHELCHLQELNHSPQFWQLVTRTIPDYQRIKKELKEK